MGFLFTILGMLLGVTLILVGNPVQMIPRFLRPVRYAAAKRVSERIRSDYPIKYEFWLLSASALTVLLLLFFLAMQAQVPGELLPVRIIIGLAAGLIPSWWLLRRQEILVSSFGIVGLYPNPRLIVSWSGLSGYHVDEQSGSVMLLNHRGHPVEALPFSDAYELQELELALRPYLTSRGGSSNRQDALPAAMRRSLRRGFWALLIAILPIGYCWLLAVRGQTVDDRLLLTSILLSLLLPLAVFNWSLRLRLGYYGSMGHVQVVHLTSVCQRCHYQAVCWQAGLHRQIRWQSGMGAVFPTYTQFKAEYRQAVELRPEVYSACCQCLLSHLQEEDIYQVDLRPLTDEREA